MRIFALLAVSQKLSCPRPTPCNSHDPRVTSLHSGVRRACECAAGGAQDPGAWPGGRLRPGDAQGGPGRGGRHGYRRRRHQPAQARLRHACWRLSQPSPGPQRCPRCRRPASTQLCWAHGLVIHPQPCLRLGFCAPHEHARRPGRLDAQPAGRGVDAGRPG